MATARKCQICLGETPFIHLISRVVRKAWLIGVDPVSGKSYEHRRGWVEERLLLLGQVFAIDICAFAIMSNHTHIVVHVDQEQAKSWSQTEVIMRWHKLYKGTLMTNKFIDGEHLIEVEQEIVAQTAEVYRNRLMDISWFMRNLNEYIARAANKEDKCTGRFWEGRFKSQALLDEKALAACLAYVDLNPVHAKMADTPEASEHTSIKLRMEQVKNGKQPKALFPFAGNPREPMPKGLPFALRDYIELVDLTGRMIRDDKRGSIALDQQPILQRLGLSEDNWLTLTAKFEERFSYVAGDCAHLTQHKKHIGHCRARGMANAKHLLQAG